MPDNETRRPFPWQPTRRTKIILGIVALIFWTGFAGQWADKGCDLIPQSYGLVLFHGTPDHWEGCDDGSYTDDYQG